jgi:hypothetical protein
LIDRVWVDLNGTYIAEITLDPRRDPFLHHHRFRQRPLLPGVLTLEAFAEAARLALPDRPFLGFSDIEFVSGLSNHDAPYQVQVEIRDQGDCAECQLVAPLINVRQDVPRRVFATGRVDFGLPPKFDPVNVGSPLFGWSSFVYPDGMIIEHGLPLRTLRQIDFQHGAGRAQIDGGDPTDLVGADRLARGRFLIPCAALDGSMVCCGFFVFAMIDPNVSLPRRLTRYRQGRLPHLGESCQLRFFYRGREQASHRFDMTLIGDNQDVIFEIHGYEGSQVVDGPSVPGQPGSGGL